MLPSGTNTRPFQKALQRYHKRLIRALFPVKCMAWLACDPMAELSAQIRTPFVRYGESGSVNIAPQKRYFTHQNIGRSSHFMSDDLFFVAVGLPSAYVVCSRVHCAAEQQLQTVSGATSMAQIT